MPKQQTISNLKHLIKVTLEDESGATAKKYGDALIRKLTHAIKLKQRRFDIVYGRGK